jgi:hypothetical protein
MQIDIFGPIDALGVCSLIEFIQQTGPRVRLKLNERKKDERLEEDLEWDQDGQYFHYDTKWLHAL